MVRMGRVDSDPGDKIMSHLYSQALTRWPQMCEEGRRRSPRGELLALLEEQDVPATFPDARGLKGTWLSLRAVQAPGYSTGLWSEVGSRRCGINP
jgi:hypothetical protein